MTLPLLSALSIQLLCSTSPVAVPEIPQDNSRSRVLDGTGLLQSLCERKTCVHSLQLLVLFCRELQPCSGEARSCLALLLPSTGHLIRGFTGKVQEQQLQDQLGVGEVKKPQNQTSDYCRKMTGFSKSQPDSKALQLLYVIIRQDSLPFKDLQV